MTPQEIIEALEIDIGDPPPWDGIIREIHIRDYYISLKVISVSDGFIIAKAMCVSIDPETIRIRASLVKKLTFVY